MVHLPIAFLFPGLGYSRSVPNINQDQEYQGNNGIEASSMKRTKSANSKLPTYKQALIVSRFNSLRPRRSSHSFSEDRYVYNFSFNMVSDAGLQRNNIFIFNFIY